MNGPTLGIWLTQAEPSFIPKIWVELPVYFNRVVTQDSINYVMQCILCITTNKLFTLS